MSWSRAWSAVLLCAALDCGAVAPGEPLPDCAAVKAAAATLAGNVVVVDFWASWCPPCRKLMPFLQETWDRERARGLTVLAINVDSDPRDAAALLARVQVSYPLAYDSAGDCPARFDVRAMPSTYLVDRRGTVRYVHTGFRQADREALRAAIAGLLDEPAGAAGPVAP